MHFLFFVLQSRHYFHWCVYPVINIEPTAEHPVPFDMSDEQPASHKDSIAIAANTASFLEQLGGSIDFNEKDGKEAVNLVTKAAPNVPKHITSPSQAKAALEILKRYDFAVIADAQQARNLITNKLIELSDCGDPKIEIKALELLGKHSDVGIFTERSEITVRHTTSQSLENSIKERIKRLLHSDVIDITPLDDLDAQLGLSDPEEIETVEEVEETKEEETDK